MIEFFRVGGTSLAPFRGLSKTHAVTFSAALACLVFMARERARGSAGGPAGPAPAAVIGRRAAHILPRICLAITSNCMLVVPS